MPTVDLVFRDLPDKFEWVEGCIGNNRIHFNLALGNFEILLRHTMHPFGDGYGWLSCLYMFGSSFNMDREPFNIDYCDTPDEAKQAFEKWIRAREVK